MFTLTVAKNIFEKSKLIACKALFQVQAGFVFRDFLVLSGCAEIHTWVTDSPTQALCCRTRNKGLYSGFPGRNKIVKALL